MIQSSTFAASMGALGLIAFTTGCVVEDDIEVGSNTSNVTFEEFMSRVYQEPWEGGVYIIDGDEPIESFEKLEEYYYSLVSGQALAVNQVGGADDKWSNTQKLNLTYCVSNNFGARKSDVVSAMNTATSAWEGAANVDFIHLTSQDSNCTKSNSNVVFDVRPVSGQPYLARAFFPSNSRGSRNVLIDSSSYNSGYPLAGILRHELGHALGFRHEHTRIEAFQTTGINCIEDTRYRALTEYDINSAMHYPQCGSNNTNLSLTARDREGAAALYGP